MLSKIMSFDLLNPELFILLFWLDLFLLLLSWMVSIDLTILFFLLRLELFWLFKLWIAVALFYGC